MISQIIHQGRTPIKAHLPTLSPFTEKYGFEIVGSHTFQLGDETQNDFCMEIRLREAGQ